MQSAGISSNKDVLRNLRLGFSGNGITSGITEAFDPKQA